MNYTDLGPKLVLPCVRPHPLAAIADVISEFDMLLIMTVEPGFGGQSFLDIMLPKIAQARALLSKDNLDIRLQIDGGVSRKLSNEPPKPVQMCS